MEPYCLRPVFIAPRSEDSVMRLLLCMATPYIALHAPTRVRTGSSSGDLYRHRY